MKLSLLHPAASRKRIFRLAHNKGTGQAAHMKYIQTTYETYMVHKDTLVSE